MTGAAPPTPREWTGDAAFPWAPAHTLADGTRVRACYCILDVQAGRTRQEQVFLKLTLGDRFGSVPARIWEGAEALAPGLRAGLYIGVDARVEIYQGELQLCLDAVTPLRVELEDLALFLPRSARPEAEMEAELAAFIASVQDAPFRALLEALLGPDTESGRGFRLAPAAKHNHHAYLGGLLEHTLSVTGVCERLAAHYGAELDRDLLLTGALLHDIGKVREIGARAGFPYTDEGKLLGHILLGLQMLHDAAAGVPALAPARLLLLEHLVASHQGRYEWQSPREPSILEAMVLHYADDLDAKLQQVRELLARAEAPWTGYDRGFRRAFLRHGGVAVESGEAEGGEAPPAVPPPGNSPPRRRSHRTAAAPARTDEAVADPPARPDPAEADAPPNGLRLSDDTLDLFGGTEP